MFGEILNGAVLPLSLTVCGIILAFRIKLFRILSPVGFFRDLKSAGTGSGTSPFVSLCTALAGTLGVGNIAGVATAIGSGGAGAVFWMWAGALISTAVKYGEVTLAVKYRRRTKDGYYGGAAYTIRDGLSFMIGPCASKLLGGSFAVLCVVNSLVMGTLIQSNSAAAVTDDGRVRAIICLLLAVGVAAVAISGPGKIGKVTSALIPPLSLVYIGISVYVIASNSAVVPTVFREIFSGAFRFRAAAGGAAGFGIKEAIRFGVTRGIFSNEAGCGTSPTAHAAANVVSPHKQGCFGIFEVIFDTPVLCTLTALVVLIGRLKYGVTGDGGVGDTLFVFGKLAGNPAYFAIGISVFLFAYATVIAQLYYGSVALRYLTRSHAAKATLSIITVAVAAVGGYVEPGVMWSVADTVVGVMTVINVFVLIMLSGTIGKEACQGLEQRIKKRTHD
ncbi:MAG: amino acid carrier protein [Clostridia bacterium]|nr:amino acid carrier protein [Clostridia bacterium]